MAERIIIGFDAKRIVRNGTGLGSYGRTLVNDLARLDEFDLRLSDMSSKARPQNIAVPRLVAMYLCRAFTRKSLPEIARAFEKTHATIVHACQVIPGRMETDPALRAHVETICERLGRDPAQLP